MAKELIREYDFCEIVLGRIRGLNSEEKEQMCLWFRKQIDTIIRGQPHAIIDFHELERDILEEGIFGGYWRTVNEAKKFVSELLRYVRNYKPVPRVSHHVIQPEFPPVYQIAKMKSQGYSNEDIIDKARTLGLEETKAREIIKDHIDKQTSFDMKAFCSELKKTQKKL